jgi:transcriptional regulator with XRE-family HTH domain
MSQVAGESASRRRAMDHSEEVAFRLRKAREDAHLSLRELARRVELSASALSQIETGKSLPSVKTLYAIVSELGISLDELFEESDSSGRPAPSTRPRAAGQGSGEPDDGSHVLAWAVPLVQRADSRASLELDSGVTWQRLTASHDPDVDFLFAIYEVGGSSSANDKLVRHSGREYGIVLTGELEVTVGFETYRLGPGDSVSFDSQEPHRLANRGEVPATAIWFVIGRRHSDARTRRFGPQPTGA